MKTIIEQYIQFAIDNGLELNGWENIKTSFIDFEGMFGEIVENRFKALIISKPFIESIARGILQINNPDNHKDFKKEDLINFDVSIQAEYITTKQAIAIRDEKLEEFIINLGIGKQEKN